MNLFQELIDKSVSRYQNSLIVLVYPWSQSDTADDGVRLSMSHKQCSRFTEILIELLERFKIGYLRLDDCDFKNRLTVLENAALKGQIRRESYNLQHYMEISDKKLRNVKKAGNISVRNSKASNDTSISFYLDSTDEKNSIRSVKICEDKASLYFTKLGEMKGRILYFINTSDLFCIEFDFKVRAADVQKMLLGNIFINGEQFSFLGCSSSGLKERKAFLLKGDSKNAESTLGKYGKFDEIPSVSKRLARIALLFSSVHMTDIKITSKMIINLDDVFSTSRKYNFTDGCGGIGSKLARAVTSQISEKDRVISPIQYLPSVYQIRLQGYKGVVALDTQIDGNQLSVRPSMRKFTTSALPMLALCGFSRPYTYGHLNRQLIFLLSALGVPDEIFLTLQRELFELISEMHVNAEAAVAMLHWMGKPDVAEMIMRLTIDENCSDITRILLYRKDVCNTLAKIKREYFIRDEKVKNDGKVKEKLRIMVKKSRLLYGVCDQLNQLKYGQCFLRITVNNVAKTVTGKIVTGRMPCYLLGDIRVLEAVDIPELSHLVDCIVFPIQGKRPHADEQAGGDLDGDKFFVTWDCRLIPPKTVQSHEYPAAESKHEGLITQAKMIRYFSTQNQAMKVTGLLANLFEQWADTKGPKSNECAYLGQLFGRAIDATKTGETLRIPDSLLKPQQLDENGPKFVWQKMAVEARAVKSKQDKPEDLRNALSSDAISEEYVLSILEDQETGLAEYEKFDFLWRFALNTFPSEIEAAEFINRKFVTKINFTLLTSTEKMLAIDAGVLPSFVEDPLTKSTILNKEDLSNDDISTVRSSWGLIYETEHSGFSLDGLIRKLPNYDAVLICFQMPDEVTICLKITERLLPGTKHAIGIGAFSAFFTSKRFGYRKKFQPTFELFYDLEDDRLQIYRNENLAQSFLWLKCSKVQSRNKQGVQIIDLLSETDVQDCISVDLSSFGGNILRPAASIRPHPLLRKAPVAYIEVYASSSGHPAYPDVLVGNEIENVEEQELECQFDEEPDDRDVCRLLLEKIEAIESQQVSSPTLRARLLDEIVNHCIPWTGNFSSETQSSLNTFLQKILSANTSWKVRIHIAVCVCRLGHHKLAENILLQGPLDQIPELSTVELLEIMEDWAVVWYIPPQIVVEWVKLLISMILSKPQVSQQESYHINVAWNTFVEFTNDVTLCKETFEMSIIDNLKLDSIKAATKESHLQVSMYRTSQLKSFAHLPANGDYVILIRRKDWKKANNTNATTSIARVISSMPAPFSVKLEISDDFTPAVLMQDAGTASSGWMINLLTNANITLYTRVIRACSSLLSSSVKKPLFRLIIGDASLSCGSNFQDVAQKAKHVNKIEEIGLNTAQISSANAALKSHLTLIHGPPGTGKTKVACAILQEAAKTECHETGVLALAETNTAVDNMTRRLAQLGMDIVRIGNVKYVPGDLYNFTLEGKLRLKGELEGRRTDFQDESGRTFHKKNYVKAILDQAQIVLTTCAGAGDSVLSGRNFKFVLVDEATQTKEGTVLCGLSRGAEQLVMIGDPNQLGPLVKIEQDWAWLSTEEQQKVSSDLEETLFHRLHNNKIVSTYFLDTQYRMHPSIADFPSKHFYNGQLKSGTTENDRKPIWQLTPAAVAFLHVAGNGKRVRTSYENTEEARKIKELIDLLLDSSDTKLAKKDIAVLALYNGQVRSLRESLPGIEISSIDGFQGREAEIILVSTVRSGGNLGIVCADILFIYDFYCISFPRRL